MPVRKLQILKFVMINPQVANRQISLASQSANRKFENLQGKGNVSDPDLFASNIFFTA
jgi:frataxin-like iron-binding protein CyaY